MTKPAAVVLDEAQVIARTRRWLERAVIGLNLCPFARAPYLQRRVRFRVSHAICAHALIADLEVELSALHAVPAAQCETTLLIHPWVFSEFLAFNDFLDAAEGCLDRLDLVGEVQIASFHPNYLFADSEPDAIENHTNRSPFPILHLLRESSIERAVDAMENPDTIFLRNQATLKRLGRSGWEGLWNE